MAGWHLSGREWDVLDGLRFSTNDKSIFRNATIILMSGVGRSKSSIAADLGCSVGTVDLICKAYREQGLAGLRPHKPTGRQSRATPEYLAALKTFLEMSPLELG